MTPEEITQSVSAAFDSVNLINQLKSLTPPLSSEDNSTLDRNIEHLKIMMGKDWFVEALTSVQVTEINLLIV